LVLLDAIVAAEEAGEEARADQLADATGLGTRQTQLGLRALYEAEFIDGIVATGMTDTFDMLDIRLLERGLRTVGQWPTEDQYAALIEVLEHRIAASTDVTERTTLERLRDATVGAGKEIVVGVLAAWARYLAGPPVP
jgi:hypothetical protein